MRRRNDIQPKIGLHWVNEYRQMSGLPAPIELFQGLRLYIGAGQIDTTSRPGTMEFARLART